jgi:hypothetical protein
MKHPALTGLAASSVALLLGFACVDADIPNVSNGLRDALAENFANAGAAAVGAAGDGGSASTPSAGAGGEGGSAGEEDEPSDPEPNGGAAGSSMAGEAGGDGEGAAGGDGMAGGCDGFTIVQMRCGQVGCHADGSAQGDFGASEEAARAYIGQEGDGLCAGEGPIIDPDDPSASVLVQKVDGSATCGSPMPLGSEPLSDDDIACIEEWIGGL